MSASLRRRLDRVQEQHDRPIRARLERIMRTHGVRLPQQEVDEIVTRQRGAGAWIQQRSLQLQAAGLTAEQIFDQMMTERGQTA
jgi:hypothetical protein